MVKVRQNFSAPQIDDISGTLRQELTTPTLYEKIRPGMSVAIAVGSRGIADIPIVVRLIAEELRRRGTVPFIVPAMGSHGGATATGQETVLADLGITPESVGCPIKSSMDVVEIGRLENGLPVYMDSHAAGADGIVLVNRIKPHTAFRGHSESGLIKMLIIGLGKQRGAECCHAHGFKYMAENIATMARIALSAKPILFGVGIIENAYDRTAKISAIPANDLERSDQELQTLAKELMPGIMFTQIDVLIVEEIGKAISGDSMDPHITGRFGWTGCK